MIAVKGAPGKNVAQAVGLVKCYEDWLKEDPSSWLWAHNRWKREAEGEKYLQEHPDER